ncbi:hypothetical protein [Oceanicaulis sp. MMSF_3324]|uniref:hypothetical protein n=1 Tax=Oceanicaulis sp. MMSF_3324 TaxID=3046702 RepID=UPI00273F086B|nr:hypothetical protein [Oceanicaulis sp. MMSF_3324]
MTLWRVALATINHGLGPAWRRMLLGVFLAGLGYLAFLPTFEARQEAAHTAALIAFTTNGHIALDQSDALHPDSLGFAGPWPAGLTGPGRLGYAGEEDTLSNQLLDAPSQRYRAHPLALVFLAPARLVAQDWSWPAQVRFYRLLIWTIAMLGFGLGVASALRFGYVDRNAAVVMAAWPFLFPHFFSQMTAVSGAGIALGCFGVTSAALMALSRRNDLTASLVLGLALGLSIWADTLMVTVWAGLALYLGWRGWRLHKYDALDSEWLILRIFPMGLALLIGSGWLIYLVTSGEGQTMTPVLGEGILTRLWSNLASFSADGGASLILPGPGWRLVSLLLLLLILMRWEFHWRALPDLAKAPAFILPIFTLSVLLMGLQGYAAGFDDLHMLAPVLALIVGLCCRSSALVIALVVLGLFGAVAHGAFQASVYAGCALYDPQLGRYGYGAAECLLDWAALEQVSAPGFALKSFAVGGLSALTALYSLWRQASWQHDD